MKRPRWFREEWVLLRQRGSRSAFAIGLADVATLAAAREAWPLAARLFAKAEAQLQAEAAAFTLPAREHYERAHHRAREALGAAAAAEAVAGRALSLEQALAEAEAAVGLTPPGLAAEPAPPTRLGEEPRSPALAPDVALTRREREVLALLCQRLTDPEIADQLVHQSPHRLEACGQPLPQARGHQSAGGRGPRGPAGIGLSQAGAVPPTAARRVPFPQIA